MRRKGFRFPARMVAGNPTPKKEYDNGCLVVDAAGALYHMKQMRGRPFFRAVPLPDGFSVGRIFVTEYPDRRHLAFLTDTAGHFYAMRADDYSLHEVAVGGFDPTTESMMIIGDMFYWTVNIESGGAERLVAVDARDYSVVEVRESPAEPSRWERAARFAFPFEPVVDLCRRRLRAAARCGVLALCAVGGGRAGGALPAVAAAVAARRRVARSGDSAARHIPIHPAAAFGAAALMRLTQ
ncbi:MAG: DUF4857 domain-containing protein [Bacteroidales bacterium]|nr:MAG: DUF4857 domain-containing protein [Bacteroidales bacterium]